MKKEIKLIPVLIEERIFIIRGKKVILDADLAVLYEVTTKRLNEQVKRNLERFPGDFMFQLTKIERDEVVAICDHLSKLRYSYQFPYAFTEHGIAMISSVLKSKKAIHMNIFIIRAFIKLRELLSTNAELAHKINEIERIQEKQGEKLEEINNTVVRLMGAKEEPKDPIGFRSD